MKRKLIEISQEYAVVCDNKRCDYKVKNEEPYLPMNIQKYINQHCPKCGENLLTEEDYNLGLNLIKKVNFINKWFGWLMFFVPKNAKQKQKK